MPEITVDFGLDPDESFEPADQEDEFDTDRPYIMTALGPISPGAAGFTLPHEHVYHDPHSMNFDDPDSRLDDPVNSLAELEDAYYAGIRTVVDISTSGANVDISEIRWIAERSPMHIVVSFGFDASSSERSAGNVADALIEAANLGIGGGPVKAGVFTVRTSTGTLTEQDKELLRGASLASRTTGAPIISISEEGTSAMERVSFLLSENVAPDKITIAHLDAHAELDYLHQLLNTGVFVSFDQFSRANPASDQDRGKLLHQLINRNYLRQLLVSGDLGRQSQWLSYGGNPGFRYIAEHIPLILMDSGCSAEEVRTMMVDNPQRSLTISSY